MPDPRPITELVETVRETLDLHDPCLEDADAALTELAERLEAATILALEAENHELEHLRLRMKRRADRINALEAENKALKKEIDGMARAPYGEHQAMRERAEKAEAQVAALREALEEAGRTLMTVQSRIERRLYGEAASRAYDGWYHTERALASSEEAG